jgi:hypothetical protein
VSPTCRSTHAHDSPSISVRARAKLNASLDPGVVCGQHGWWQGSSELGLPDDDPFTSDGVNLNLVLRQTPSDPLSGSSPLRASVCQILPITEEAIAEH